MNPDKSMKEMFTRFTELEEDWDESDYQKKEKNIEAIKMLICGISVDGNHLPIASNAFTLNSDGSGGMIIDSGTTLFYLEQNVYSIVRQAFVNSKNLTLVSAPSSRLDLCFQLPSGSSNPQLPSLVLNFANGKLELPTLNYFVLVSQRVIFLAM
ncbi:Aspartic proteinase nepenthesin-1-like protein [Drosera capensis]